MTPDDAAEYRAIHTPENGTCAYCETAAPCHGERLCDALQQAWAESDSRREEANRWAARFGEQQARAERAEAEELLARNAVADAMQHIDELYAVLARVRALCDPAVLPPEASRLARNIRAAIEGGDRGR